MSNQAASRPHPHPEPTTVNRKVWVRRKNANYRNREYLSEQEVNTVIAAATRVGRQGHRDATLILMGADTLVSRKPLKDDWRARNAD